MRKDDTLKSLTEDWRMSPKIDYNFAEVPLTAGIAKELILEMFAGKTVGRQTIAKTIIQVHRERGGKDAEAQDVVQSVIKKALGGLKADGKAENPPVGNWRINSMRGSLGSQVPEESESPEIPPDEEEINELVSRFEKCIGYGEGAVYLYYFPTYRHFTESKGNSWWPCKIGRTDHDPILRVKTQAGTAMPENPEIALFIKTDNTYEMETAIHGILAVRGKRLETAPGTEWFLTCPSEVEEIHDFIQEHRAEDQEPV